MVYVIGQPSEVVNIRVIIPLRAEEGWRRRRRRRGTQFGHHFAGLTTPARQLLLSCRATPPLRGGEYSFSSNSFLPHKAANIVDQVPDLLGSDTRFAFQTGH